MNSDQTSSFPPEAFATHLAILGKTGSGKTTTAKGFAETLMDSGRRICAIDPTGVWWGLRLKADGRTPGHPVVIFGGSHADVPIEEATSGKRLAEIIAKGSFSSVLDTSLMTVGSRTRFFTEFAESLFRANSRPLHLVIDEAHLFAPQGRVPDPQSGRMLHAANNLVSGGRSRGLRIMLISQRPAKLHKDSLTQVETLIAMRLIAPQDRAAVQDWIGEWADAKQGKEVISSLPSLPRGEGWAWCPELGMLEKLSFPAIQTFDSSRTPEDGEYIQVPADLSKIDLVSIRDALTVTEVGEKEKGKPTAPTDGQIQEAEQRGYKRGFQDGFRDGERSSLEGTRAKILGLFNSIDPAGHGIADVETRINSAPPSRGPERQSFHEKPSHFTTQSPKSRAGTQSAGSGSDGIGPARTGQPELRILRVLAARHPAKFTRAQWATLARMKKNSGTWQTYLSRLRVAGFIVESDGLFGLTAAGLKAAGRVDRPASGSVVQQWRDALGSGPSKIIDVVLSIYPKGIHRANLADRVGMVATSGTFQTYLSRLKSNGLIEVRNREIVASSILFVDKAA